MPSTGKDTISILGTGTLVVVMGGSPDTPGEYLDRVVNRAPAG
jgi:hypothetical protein